MLKRSKKFVVLFFLILVSASINAQDIPKPTGYVNDFAQVLPPETEKSLNGKIQSYKDATGIEVAVVTVPSLQGYGIDQFTIKLAQNWGVGQKERDNGVVLLLAPKEREVRIEVGYGLEGDLTDGRSGQILDQVAVPYFKKEDWSGGINATVDELISYLGQQTYQARLAEKEQIRQMQLQKQREFNASLSLFFTFAVPIVLVVVLFAVIRVWYKHRKVLQQIKKTNSVAIHEILKKFKNLELSSAEAERVIVELNEKGVNFDSVKDKYESMLKEIKPLVDNFQIIIIALESRNKKLRQAGMVSDMVAGYDKNVEKAIKDANMIIALPLFLLRKKAWVIESTDNIYREAVNVQTRIQSVLPKLDDEFGKKIAQLNEEAFKSIHIVNLKLYTEKEPSPDWIHLGNLLEATKKNTEQITICIDEYFGLVEKAKKEKPNLLVKLEAERAKAEKALNGSDVKTSTKTIYFKALAKTEPVRQLYPEKEQEWVSFLKQISSLIEEFEKITARAKMDVKEAEDERWRAKQREEEARQARIRASQRSSYSSSNRSSGFGGGGFGGGGASRKF